MGHFAALACALCADTVPAVMANTLQHELLPYLTDDSARNKVHAIARIQQMAVCLVRPCMPHALCGTHHLPTLHSTRRYLCHRVCASTY